MHDPKRLLHFPNLLNARDLGGYPTVDGAHTRWRSLVRADDLSQVKRAFDLNGYVGILYLIVLAVSLYG